MIKGIKFVGVPVSNQDAALKFWTEAVGMKVDDRSALQREAALDRGEDCRARKLASPCSHRRATRTASASFSPFLFGATTFSRPLRR